MAENIDNFPALQPPIEGFKVFGSSDPWIMNACLNFQHDMSYGYTEGYLYAAESLIDHIEETQSHQDILIYPIVFLYRHHLELRLKKILHSLHLLGLRKDGIPDVHDLVRLWQECEPQLRKLSPQEDKEWFKSITKCFQQISAVDPNSDAFRYPQHRDGSTSVKNIKHINLSQLKNVMTSIASWLSGASDYLDDCLNNLRSCI